MKIKKYPAPDLRITQAPQAEKICTKENLIVKFIQSMTGHGDMILKMHYFVFHAYFVVEIMDDVKLKLQTSGFQVLKTCFEAILEQQSSVSEQKDL